MVYYTKTLVVLHGLTPRGEEEYRKFLEDEGTRILYKAQHPIRYYSETILDFFRRIFRR